MNFWNSESARGLSCGVVIVYYCSTHYKAVRVGEGESGEHVPLPTSGETTSRGLCELVCSSRTNEHRRKGDCVKGGGEEGERERERALGVQLRHTRRC